MIIVYSFVYYFRLDHYCYYSYNYYSFLFRCCSLLLSKLKIFFSFSWQPERFSFTHQKSAMVFLYVKNTGFAERHHWSDRGATCWSKATTGQWNRKFLLWIDSTGWQRTGFSVWNAFATDSPAELCVGCSPGQTCPSFTIAGNW